MQNRSEGRLFYDTFRENMSSFKDTFLEDNLRIPVFMFWSQTSLSNFYETFKSPNINITPSKYQGFDLTGRHFGNVSISKGTSTRKRHKSFSFNVWDLLWT